MTACSSWGRPQAGDRRRRAAGFTAIELITVLVVVGVLVTIALHAIQGSFLGSARRSATRTAAAYLVRARMIAVQQSRRSWLVRSGNVLKVLVDSSGTPVQLGSVIDFSQKYGAALSASPTDTMAFDPRGFLANITLNPKLMITLNGATDTICVAGLGKITTRSCT